MPGGRLCFVRHFGKGAASRHGPAPLTLTTDGMPVTGRRVDVAALTALAQADEFRASFAGDGTYCASDDTAPIEVGRRSAHRGRTWSWEADDR